MRKWTVVQLVALGTETENALKQDVLYYKNAKPKSLTARYSCHEQKAHYLQAYDTNITVFTYLFDSIKTKTNEPNLSA